MSGTLEERIQRLEDIGAIRRLKHRYMAYADAGYDADGIMTLMTPDAVWDGGEAFGAAGGRRGLRQHGARGSASRSASPPIWR